MRQKYEIINFTPNMPINCSLQKIGIVPLHFHDFFEVVMILSGSCRLTVGDQIFTMQADDVVSFNCHTPHTLSSSDCVLISVQFDQTMFENTLPNPFRPTFDCNSAKQGDLPAFGTIRQLIARLVKNNADQKSGYELRNWSLVFDLMDVLYNNFRVDDSSPKTQQLHRYADRMARINRIISENYTQNFTLSELAAQVHLSVPYLSKFFDQHYGMNFLSYLTEIRLNHAIAELTNTDDTIERIAAGSGFPNSHAFVQAFKKQYGQLPSVYRRRKNAQAQDKPQQFEPEQHDYIAGLKKYLAVPEASQSPEQVFSCQIHCNAKDKGTAIRHSWRSIMPGGSARDLLFSEIQDMVRRMQREVGFERIYFHGVLSDEMRLCSRSKAGSLTFSFLYVDKVLDFILSVGLQPILELGFMPEALAKNPQKKFLNYCTSEPASLEEWTELVRCFTEHLLSRYGAQRVRTWLFCPWNNPDSPKHMFAFSADEGFYRFYQASWQAIKQCDEKIPVGTPATYYIVGHPGWYLPFLKWCSQNHCPPDFLNFHYYDTVQQRASPDTQELFGFAGAMTLGETPDGLSDFVRLVRRDNNRKLPIYLTEWNNTPSHQDWLNDTCFKSCYLAKGILENMDALDSFSYWSLTDWMGEAAVQPELFSGGLGLFTRNGIPKPGFYVLTLLQKLGNTCISKGEGWYITRSEDRYQILLYNYRHFSHLYALGERFDMTFTDRYTPFSPERSMDTHVILENIPQGDYLVREVIVSRKSGSAFDHWVSMGALELDNELELKNLEARSQPAINKYLVTARDGILELDALLEMLEVRLLTVEPV